MAARYTVERGATVRETARQFGAGKSTVHKDLTVRLQVLDPALAEQVREVLDLNKSERHIRGGRATYVKYKQIKSGGVYENVNK